MLRNVAKYFEIFRGGVFKGGLSGLRFAHINNFPGDLLFLSQILTSKYSFFDFGGAQLMVFHASLVFKFCMCFDLCALSALRENHEKT